MHRYLRVADAMIGMGEEVVVAHRRWELLLLGRQVPMMGELLHLRHLLLLLLLLLLHWIVVHVLIGVRLAVHRVSRSSSHGRMIHCPLLLLLLQWYLGMMKPPPQIAVTVAVAWDAAGVELLATAQEKLAMGASRPVGSGGNVAVGSLHYDIGWLG